MLLQCAKGSKSYLEGSKKWTVFSFKIYLYQNPFKSLAALDMNLEKMATELDDDPGVCTQFRSQLLVPGTVPVNF